MAVDTRVQKRESQPGQIERTQAGEIERTRSGVTYAPLADIVEVGDKLLLMCDLPGVAAGDLDITFERGVLTIHGKVQPRQNGKTGFLRQEYGIGDFHRVFEIGEGIQHSQIQAELRNGVLTVHLPKTQEVMPRRITVKAT